MGVKKPALGGLCLIVIQLMLIVFAFFISMWLLNKIACSVAIVACSLISFARKLPVLLNVSSAFFLMFARNIKNSSNSVRSIFLTPKVHTLFAMNELYIKKTQKNTGAKFFFGG